ncbi:hypothetical protein BD289DRAFT_129673 [Coniella lustricola]|uniref:Uncharacterized protein n=1 Tax=Coniella lustricola TaxID=2025994 RepID=A0A2T2ZW03_9PEZI|nr:hypothetical protein BD289DRAFT_129673 [Coniella lustricola]
MCFPPLPWHISIHAGSEMRLSPHDLPLRGAAVSIYRVITDGAPNGVHSRDCALRLDVQVVGNTIPKQEVLVPGGHQRVILTRGRDGEKEHKVKKTGPGLPCLPKQASPSAEMPSTPMRGSAKNPPISQLLFSFFPRAISLLWVRLEAVMDPGRSQQCGFFHGLGCMGHAVIYNGIYASLVLHLHR